MNDIRVKKIQSLLILTKNIFIFNMAFLTLGLRSIRILRKIYEKNMSIIQKKNVTGVQFHPEKASKMELISRKIYRYF